MTRSSFGQSDTGLLTMAFGSAKYIDFAIALASSIREFGRWSGPLAIVTDRPARELPMFDVVIRVDSAHGDGVEQKLSLDQYTPFEETLFVDCDCLVYRGLEPTIELFRRSGPFGALAGHYEGSGSSHYGLSDVAGYLDYADIERLPAFNSGVLWWTPAGSDVFSVARSLAADLPDGLVNEFKAARLPDEPLLGAAMEQLGIGYAIDRADHMVPTVAALSLRDLDVVTGRSVLSTVNGVVAPAVVHFNFGGQSSLTYARERYRARHPSAGRGRATVAVLPGWGRHHGFSWARSGVKGWLKR